MWFGSIWIFTLRLPWVLKVDLFLRQVVDGDPASNTLSRRWVAGLHTRGRAYVARAENIARYTDGRYRPVGLNETPQALAEDVVHPLTPLAPAGELPAVEVAVLLHLDDLNPESLELGAARVARVGALVVYADGASEQVRTADREAMADALERAGAHFECDADGVQGGWSGDLPLVSAWAPVGPSAAALHAHPPRVGRARLAEVDARLLPAPFSDPTAAGRRGRQLDVTPVAPDGAPRPGE